jgi:tRNA U55 pseudouridine synthase TruB
VGASTETGDPEGAILETAPIPSLENVDSVLQSMVGVQMQRPPPYSAVKFKGKALYKYARAGEKVEVPEKEIEIYAMTLLDQGEDWIRVEIRCSRGTYARVIANDVAMALGSVGHLSQLRRSQSGNFTLDESVDMPGLAQIVASREDYQEVFSREGERVKWNPKDDVQDALFARTQSLLEAFPRLHSVECTERETIRIRTAGVVPPPPVGVKDGERYLAVSNKEVLALLQAKGRIGQPVRVVGEKSSRR